MPAKKVLVIEDEPRLLNDIAEMLTYEEYQVDIAENGVVGIEKIHSFKPDLIVCDIMMPAMDGYEVLEHIRKNPLTAPTPFIFLTAKSDHIDMRYGMELGADDYITKPFSSNELLASIRARFIRHAQILGLPVDAEPRYTKNLHNVFLSYSRKDKIVMERIRDDLRRQKLSVWTDEHLKPGTAAWKAAIQEAIENAGCVVVILSPDAKISEWVNRELDYASEYGVHIFPILARGNSKDAIPIELIRSQYTDVRTHYEGEMNKLINAIREYVGIYG